MGNDDDAAFEVPKIFFEHIQCDNIKVVGRFVKHQEVWITHQDGAQVKTAALSPTQFVDIAMLRFGSKQEMLQELRSSQFLSITQFDYLGNVLNDVNHFHLFVKLKPVLRVIAEADRFADVHCAAIGLYLPH